MTKSRKPEELLAKGIFMLLCVMMFPGLVVLVCQVAYAYIDFGRLGLFLLTVVGLLGATALLCAAAWRGFIALLRSVSGLGSTPKGRRPHDVDPQTRDR